MHLIQLDQIKRVQSSHRESPDRQQRSLQDLRYLEVNEWDEMLWAMAPCCLYGVATNDRRLAMSDFVPVPYLLPASTAPLPSTRQSQLLLRHKSWPKPAPMKSLPPSLPPCCPRMGDLEFSPSGRARSLDHRNALC